MTVLCWWVGARGMDCHSQASLIVIGLTRFYLLVRGEQQRYGPRKLQWFISCSVTQSFPTFCDPMDCSMPGFPVLHHLLELSSNSCPLSQWCHPTISSSVVPFSSCLQSFPASGSFPMSQLFLSGGQSVGVSASASVLLMNIQEWFPLGWTDLISMQSKGLSRVFSNTTVQKHQFFGTQPSLWYNSHIHAWLLEKPCRIKPMIYPHCLIPRLLPRGQVIYVWNNPRKLR